MIVGVDISSRRIDLAWLDEHGLPQRWHQEISGGKHDDELIDRIRRIRIQWPDTTTYVAIEYPYARGDGIPALWSTVGIVTRQAPPWAEITWADPRNLRAAIGAKNTKDAAHQALIHWACNQPFDARIVGELMNEWTPDELDALVACVGWTNIIALQDLTA